MNHPNISSRLLSQLTEDQLENVAALLAFDPSLTDLWRKQVQGIVKNDNWEPDTLLRSVTECMEGVVNDIEQIGYDRIWEFRMKRIFNIKRKKGRVKGEGKGAGAVQKFVKQRGGRRFLARMYSDMRSANAVADHIYHRYGFYCCGNSIRNLLRSYHIPRNPSGGDRRSPAQNRFRDNRDRRQ